MDIAQQLLAQHSVENIQKVSEYIGNEEDRFAELIQLMLITEGKLPQYAAWAMSYCTDKYPSLILPHIPTLLPLLTHPTIHDAVKRSIIRVLQFCELPEPYWGEIYNACFQVMDNPHAAIALRAFSMTVLARIVEHYPELAQELYDTIQTHLQFGSPGIRNRGAKTMQQIAKYL